MCGIFGLYYKQPLQKKNNLARQAAARMGHRGPDEEGYYEDDLVTLAVCRLSIVDVAGGQQPHINTQQNLVLICNGEIYNHLELRHLLEQKGHQFKTGSDTEVILHLYVEKGPALLEYLSGMFAFALWDQQRETLLLARDRIGIKPLYIYSDDKAIAFSSEMSSLIDNLNLSSQLLPEKIWEFFSYGFPVDNRQSIHQHIRRLLPGEGCLITKANEQFFTYWSPAYLEDQKSDTRLSLKEMENRYTHALSEHFVCEVPSAVMLSGGLDSASMITFAHALGYQPQAITVGYDGDFPGDERALAREVATLFDLEINEVLLTYNGYADAFDALMHCCDEPVADIAAIPQWKIFEHAKGLGIKVLINGLGGDEIFYGYGVWNEASELFINDAYHPFFSEDDVSGFFYHPAYRAARDFLDRCAMPAFKGQGLGSDLALYDRFNGVDLEGVDRIYHLLFKTWLPNNCLLLADRLSMAHSVELRVPLLDHRLVEHVQELPHTERFFGDRGKVLLKKLLENKLPSSIVERPKQGFTPPGKYMKKLISSNRETIFDSELVNSYFSVDEMERLWADDTYLEVWFRLLVFAKWHTNTFH